MSLDVMLSQHRIVMTITGYGDMTLLNHWTLIVITIYDSI